MLFDLEIVEGEKISHLDFIKVNPEYIFCVVNFVHKKTKILCGSFFVEIPNKEKVASIFGYGLIGNYIGKGLGEEFFLRSLNYLIKEKGVSGLSIIKQTMNKFSIALWETLKLRTDIEIFDMSDKYIVKINK